MRTRVAIDRRRAPIAGFASQADACVALAEAGESPEAIAQRIGRDANHVRATLRRRRAAPKPRTFSLPLPLLRGLESAAAARGIPAVELATRLFAVIVSEDVIDALLGEPE